MPRVSDHRLRKKRSWCALAHLLQALAPQPIEPWPLITDMLQGPTLGGKRRPNHGRLCFWLFAGTRFDDVSRAFRRLARKPLEIGPDKAAGWVVFAAYQVGAVTMSQIEALATRLGVPPPSFALPAIPLDASFGSRTWAAADRRLQLRDRVTEWLLEQVPDHDIAGAIHRFHSAVDGAATPSIPSSPIVCPIANDDEEMTRPAIHARSPRKGHTLTDLRRLIGHRTHVHQKAHMLHQRAHGHEIMARLDEQIELGNHTQVAALISQMLPVYRVLNALHHRAQHMQAILEAADDREMPSVHVVHARLEGRGVHGHWRGDVVDRAETCLSDESLQQLERTRRNLERGLDDAGHPLTPVQTREHLRLLQAAEIARLRMMAALVHRDDLPQARAHLRHAWHLARIAHHESLEITVHLDLSAYEREANHLSLAYQAVTRALAIASRQRNDRRHLKARLEAARILTARGSPDFAWYEVQKARHLFARLQTDTRGRPLAEWYETALRHDIEAAEADLRRLLPDGVPDIDG